MRLNIITETIEDQLETLAQRHQTTPELIKRTAQKPNQKYWKWTLQQWYQNKIRLPEDETRVKQTLNQFSKTLSRIPPNNRDINKYQTLSQIEQITEPLLGIESSTRINTNIDAMPGTRLISKQGPYETYKITDADTLAELGEGTKWCTRASYDDCQAEEYLEQYEEIFIIFQNGRPVIQYTPDYAQVMDVNDDPVTNKKLLSIIFQNGRPVIQYAPDDQVMDVNDDPVTNKKLLSIIPAPNKPGRDTPRDAVNYARFIIGGRWPEAEPFIMKGPGAAVEYARDFIKGRWPEAEPSIMKDPKAAVEYARDFIKGRWPEAEPRILAGLSSLVSPSSAYVYARDIIKGRWPEAEPYLMRAGKSYAVNYALNVIKGRWPEAEPYIFKPLSWEERRFNYYDAPKEYLSGLQKLGYDINEFYK